MEPLRWGGRTIECRTRYRYHPRNPTHLRFRRWPPEHDALGVEFGIRGLGLGEREVGSSHGDSGGPSSIDGKIAGIVSSGWSPSVPGVDVTDENDTSFGEIFTDTRVSAYARFIGSGNQPSPAKFAVDFLPGSDRIGFDGDISLSADIQMQAGPLDNTFGTFLQLTNSDTILGFVENVSPDQLAGHLTHVALP